MKKECVAMLLAGGQGSRLYVLTGSMAKPAVPFGGKFRIIDFPLSNCTNSGIDTVGVLTQYRPLELNTYIGSGQPWELDRVNGGVHILPPYQSAGGAVWYKGTANAIYQNIGFVDLYDPEYVLVLSGDHIYKMDYSLMLRRHKATGADCTISVMEVPWEEASRFGIMSVDGDDHITEFAEKPKEPKSNLASMGIYIFTWKKLRQYLIDDETDPRSDNDFGKNIIPAMLRNGEKMSAYRFEGYWKDVGTLDSLWDANMDMLSPGSGLNLLDKKWRIYGRTPTCPPTYIGKTGDVGNSAVAKGCTVLGEVKNAVLSTGTTVAEGASVSYSVVMPGAVIEAGAKVSYAIVGEGCHVGKNAVVGGAPGIGKSTLMLQICQQLGRTCKVLYVSGEESQAQVRMRASRIGAMEPNLLLASTTDLSTVLGLIEQFKPALAIVDSAQTIVSQDVDGISGGSTQVREVASALIDTAKTLDIPVLLVGHVTKDGSIAGPRTLEHLVDVVCQFEGDAETALRMLRAVKNRFGPTDEVGCFDMSGEGIEEVTDPSGLFLSTGNGSAATQVDGTCVTFTLDGHRSLPIEVQALVTRSVLPTPRRAANGVDSNRIAMLVAVLYRHGGINLLANDLYISTIAGGQAREPGRCARCRDWNIGFVRRHVLVSPPPLCRRCARTSPCREWAWCRRIRCRTRWPRFCDRSPMPKRHRHPHFATRESPFG